MNCRHGIPRGVLRSIHDWARASGALFSMLVLLLHCAPLAVSSPEVLEPSAGLQTDDTHFPAPIIAKLDEQAQNKSLAPPVLIFFTCDSPLPHDVQFAEDGDRRSIVATPTYYLVQTQLTSSSL